eukprot:1934545-Rhodomonas_salina.1
MTFKSLRNFTRPFAEQNLARIRIIFADHGCALWPCWADAFACASIHTAGNTSSVSSVTFATASDQYRPADLSASGKLAKISVAVLPPAEATPPDARGYTSAQEGPLWSGEGFPPQEDRAF